MDGLMEEVPGKIIQPRGQFSTAVISFFLPIFLK